MTRTGIRRLSDQQFFCLWAIALGSYGSGSNKRTLTSLVRLDLIYGAEWQGGWRWHTTELGESVIDNNERAKT